jgi:hypothetical protein
MKKKLYILIVVVVSLSGCYYDNEEELYPNSVRQNDTSTVSYSATIAPMVATNCSTPGCHTANGQSPDLTTYQGIFNSRSTVKSRAVLGSPSWMPAAGPMSDANRSALGRWIDAGAPNN